MGGLSRAAIVVLLFSAGFVWCGELLTSISGAGGVAVGGDVGVERGNAVFFGKGKCYTCHSVGGKGSAVRCPNLGVFGDQFRKPIGVRATERKAKEGYSGVKYMIESLYDPDAYIVSGFPKGLMPPIHRPPIGLDEDEIASVILFLMSESGVDGDAATMAEMKKVQKTFAAQSGSGDAPPAAIALPGGDPRAGQVAFAKLGCLKCHKIQGVAFALDEPIPPGGVGPDLTSIGAIQGREYLIESILEPNAIVVADPPGQKRGDEGSYAAADGWSKMPKFHAEMSVQQMLDIAAFLGTLTDEQSNAKNYP
jgi:mono/diheme cytochrome c family protein